MAVVSCFLNFDRMKRINKNGSDQDKLKKIQKLDSENSPEKENAESLTQQDQPKAEGETNKQDLFERAGIIAQSSVKNQEAGLNELRDEAIQRGVRIERLNIERIANEELQSERLKSSGIRYPVNLLRARQANPTTEMSIVLHWNLNLDNNHAKVSFYRVFACRRLHLTDPPLPIPRDWEILCEQTDTRLPISNLINEETYYFAVLGVDEHKREGPLSRVASAKLMYYDTYLYCILLFNHELKLVPIRDITLF
uniref:Activating transcription factor 7-interacting protein Fn3 domain-containing protein n=1 Tax=Strigamia maritima TaxID=126957 RepID=T1IWP0_STRMM